MPKLSDRQGVVPKCSHLEKSEFLKNVPNPKNNVPNPKNNVANPK